MQAPVQVVNSCGVAPSSVWFFITKTEPPSQYYYANLIEVIATAHGAYSFKWAINVQIFNPNDNSLTFLFTLSRIKQIGQKHLQVVLYNKDGIEQS